MRSWARRIAIGFLGAIALSAAGCGSSAGHPDTGVGAGATVPPTLNCVDACARVGSCAELLCNEDTMSERYTGLGALLATDCQASCTDATVMSSLTDAQWQCLFQSS